MEDPLLHIVFSNFNVLNSSTVELGRSEGSDKDPGPTEMFRDSFLDNANDNQFRIMTPAFIFVCILIIIGLPGNMISILVYATQLKKGIARYFILTLAVSDLLSLLCVAPVELWIMKHFWTFNYPELCKTFRFSAYAVNNISSLTLLVIAFERYRIICCPWKQKFGTQFSKIICVLITIAAMATSFPMLFVYGTYTMPFIMYNVESEKLSRQKHSEEKNITYTIYGKTCMVDDKMATSSFPFYVNIVYIVATVIVFCVLIFLYGCIARQLIIQKMQNKNDKSRKRHSKRLKRVTVMVLVLTVVYETCYLPCLTLVCLRLVNPYFYSSLNDGGKKTVQFFLKSYLINSAINPCIYCFCNKEFRLGVRRIFRKIKLLCLKDDARRVSESCVT